MKSKGRYDDDDSESDRNDDSDSVSSDRRKRRRNDEKSALFEEPKTQIVRPTERRLENALSQITVEMIEDVRLTSRRLTLLLEHPRAHEYIVGAYVRYPVLESEELVGVSYLPSQLVRIQGPEREILVVQYTKSDQNSLKICKENCSFNKVSSEPFTAAEVEVWKSLLKLYAGKPGVEKLYTLPKSMKIKKDQLASFTFTDADVNAILQAKKSDGAMNPTLNMRNLYSKKSELLVAVRELRTSIQKGNLPAQEHSTALKSLRMKEEELRTISSAMEKSRDVSFPSVPLIMSSIHTKEAGLMGSSKVPASKLSRKQLLSRVVNELGQPLLLQNDISVARPTAESEIKTIMTLTGRELLDFLNGPLVKIPPLPVVVGESIRESSSASSRAEAGESLTLEQLLLQLERTGTG